jgi:chromosome segregation ATPase
MSRRQIERRLRDVGDRLRALRDDLNITEEQLTQLTDEADDARLRALVSETPLAEREHRQAGRHADALRNHRDDVAARIVTLEADQDALLDQLTGS